MTASFRIGFATLLSVLVCWGCSQLVAPPGPPSSPFSMPATGDPTDSSLRIGDSFPEIVSVDLDGNTVKFDESLFGERYTLLIFWSTWCGFCMQELQHEVELAKRYEPAGLRVVGINSDTTRKIAKAAAENNMVPWLNVFEGPKKTISNRLGVNGLPTLLLLDYKGMVVMGTPQLRTNTAIVRPDGSIETGPDGKVQRINALDWALETLLSGQ